LLTVILIALGIGIAGVCSWNIYQLNQAPGEIITVRSVGKIATESETEAKQSLDRINIPSDLSSKVTLDLQRRELTIKGVLDEDEASRLKAAIEYEPWRDAVVEDVVLAEEKAHELSEHNEQLRSWLFVFGIGGLIVVGVRIWCHVALSRRKQFLEEIKNIREANNEQEMEARLMELLREGKEAKPHLAWLRDEFRRSVPMRRTR
jgi:hypothetical protein